MEHQTDVASNQHLILQAKKHRFDQELTDLDPHETSHAFSPPSQRCICAPQSPLNTTKIPLLTEQNNGLTLVRRISREELMKEEGYEEDDEDSSCDSTTTRIIRKRCSKNKSTAIASACQSNRSRQKHRLQQPIWNYDLDFLMHAKRFIPSHFSGSPYSMEKDNRHHCDNTSSISSPSCLLGQFLDCYELEDGYSVSSVSDSSFSDDNEDARIHLYDSNITPLSPINASNITTGSGTNDCIPTTYHEINNILRHQKSFAVPPQGDVFTPSTAISENTRTHPNSVPHLLEFPFLESDKV